MKEHYYYVSYSAYGVAEYFILPTTRADFPFSEAMNWLRLGVGDEAVITSWQKVTEDQANEISGYTSIPRLPGSESMN